MSEKPRSQHPPVCWNWSCSTHCFIIVWCGDRGAAASSLYGTTAEAMQLIGHNECSFIIVWCGDRGAAASSLYGTTAEAMQLIGHNECMFMESDHNASNIGILIGIPFNCILGFTAVVLTRSSLEFVCAQTPHNMKGLLIGLLFTLYVVTGTLVFSAWSKIWLAILGTSTWYLVLPEHTSIGSGVICSTGLGHTMVQGKREMKSQDLKI